MSADEIECIRERHRLGREAGIGVPIYEAALLAALDASQREAERLRGQLTAMHRRAQRAEGIADRVAADRPQGAHGRSVGRALANYAAHRHAQERDEALAEVERMRRAARAELLAEIDAREPATDADVRVALLLDALADARRAAIEEAAARVASLVVGRWRAQDLATVSRCLLRMVDEAPERDGAMVDAIRAEDDQARRAALEEAIAVCDDALIAHVNNDTAYRKDERNGLRVARHVVDGALRALLDAPAPARKDA